VHIVHACLKNLKNRFIVSLKFYFSTKNFFSQHESYNSNNIVVLYGGDFEYEDATQYFQNIDAMIETINNIVCLNFKKRVFPFDISNL
jgi:hypothetical protein